MITITSKTIKELARQYPKAVYTINADYAGHPIKVTYCDSYRSITTFKDTNGEKHHLNRGTVSRCVSLPKREWEYVVDLDERGDYFAHVEDQDGNIAWQIDTEGAQQLVEDGFVKYMSAKTVMAYLKEQNVI